MDFLQDMLDRQVAFQARLKHFNADVPQTKKLIAHADMLLMEAAEAKDWCPWKQHKQDYLRQMTEEELQEYVNEMIDALHFVLNGLLEAGLTTSQDVYAHFILKNTVNHKRQDEGY